jgi:hypothetical protein
VGQDKKSPRRRREGSRKEEVSEAFAGYLKAAEENSNDIF